MLNLNLARINYQNEILHDINQLWTQKKYLDCNLVFSDGSIKCHAAMLQHSKVWWTKSVTSEMDELYIVLPEMSIMEGRKLLNYIYSGVDLGDSLLEEFSDVNNNSDEQGKQNEGELLSFRRKIGVNKNIDDSWVTREDIVKYAKKHKDYDIASEKFGVEVSVIRKWVDSNKTIENIEGQADKTKNNEDEEEDSDSQEDEDDDPDFGSVSGKKKNPRIKRVKEFPDDIKEAAVKYGLEHGWTAAAAKFGTSSTSVSRWATYDDPKSPWKFKVSPK